jgi:hypothetical protein
MYLEQLIIRYSDRFYLKIIAGGKPLKLIEIVKKIINYQTNYL